MTTQAAPAVTYADDTSTGDLAIFCSTRPRLFAIAYRILGDAGEAEDVVQDAWLRWQRTDRAVVTSPTAFLATTTARLAINVMQSARKRHEARTFGQIPDPSDSAGNPESGADQTEAAELAVFLLMEKLSPAELAAYLLRKAFGYPYQLISQILHLGAAHARQLVSRAATRLAAGRRQPVKSAAHRRLVRAFLTASRTGDLADLEDLLAADVVGQPTRTARAMPRTAPAT